MHQSVPIIYLFFKKVVEKALLKNISQKINYPRFKIDGKGSKP
jgi:hypothetical protein